MLGVMPDFWNMERAREPEAGNHMGLRILRVGMGIMTLAGLTQLSSDVDQRRMAVYPYFRSLQGGDDKLSVLTWNIHMGRTPEGRSNRAGVLALLTKVRPDVICLQEMAKNSGLLAMPGYTKVFSPTHLQPWTAEQMGNAIFTRLPFQRAHEEVLGWSIERPMRTAVSAEITKNGRNLNIATAHLESIDAGLRRNQNHNLAGFLKQENTKILCGDLNETAGQPVQEYLEAQGFVGSKCSKYGKRMAIDVIMLQKDANFTAGKCRFIETDLSDHPALIGEFLPKE